jgi:glycosyltransferase involved in cell wall biosynthesis
LEQLPYRRERRSDWRDLRSRALGTPLVVVHDYLTQRGGAERVVLALAKIFPDAPMVTSLYDPRGTFPEFGALRLRTTWLQRIPIFRTHHRLALPLYASVFSRMTVAARVVLCSTSGWAHGVKVNGYKVLYVYNTARWLYQTPEYLGSKSRLLQAVLQRLFAPLRRWDRRKARSADKVIAISNGVKGRIREHWGIDAEVVYPPHSADLGGERRPVLGMEPGFLLAVTRLLPYKRVDALVQAMGELKDLRLVIVGKGPEEHRLKRAAPDNCTFLRAVDDAELRWLYTNASGLVSAANEDFGLVPLEAMAFGCPVAVLRAGGFLETVIEGTTGVFFDTTEPGEIRDAIRQLLKCDWDQSVLAAHAGKFSTRAFADRIRQIVDEAGS